MTPKYASTELATTLPDITGSAFDTNYKYPANNEGYTDEDGNLVFVSHFLGTKATGACYGNGIDRNGGAIIADWNKSLRYADGYVSGLPRPRVWQ